jgi:predicted flap endonuclease-1-like 5' DNA nuclease
MYLLSQLWLYLLLACLAGLGLGLLLNRICQQRRHAAQLAALQTQYQDDRTRADAALAAQRTAHAQALEAAGAEQAALQARLDALDTEHRQTSARALALSSSVDEHHAARQGLGAEVESLQGRLDTLQTAYESRITLLNTETSRAAHLSDQLADLQTRHAALEAEHHTTLANQTDVAKEAYDALLTAHSERDTARQAAASTEAELTHEREAALLAAGVAATAALAARKSHQDELAALNGELTALQGTHSATLSAQEAQAEAARQAAEHAAAAQQQADEALAHLRADLDAARQAATDEAERAAVAARQQADTIAALEAELAALRDHRQALQGDLSHHQSLLSNETGRGVELLAALTALQGTHSATVSAQEAQAEAARQAAEQAAEQAAAAQQQADEALARLRAELEAARQAAAATESDLQARLAAEHAAAQQADAAAKAAAQAAADEAERAAAAARQQADTIASLEAELAALRDQRQALQGDLSHHQSLLSTETGRGVELLAALTALQGTHTATVSAQEAQAEAARQAAEHAAAAQQQSDEALARLRAELDAARQAAAASELDLQAQLAAEHAAAQQAQADAKSAAQAAADDAERAAAAARQQADAIAALEAELAVLRDQRQALQGDLSHHQSLLSTETGRGVELLAELDTARQAAAAAERDLQARLAAEHAAVQQAEASAQAAAQAAADDAAQAAAAARQQADTIAALEAQLASVRQAVVSSEADGAARAARVTELESELTREREVAVLAAAAAAAAALHSRQSHQDALTALERQQAVLVDQAAQRDRQLSELQATLADQEAAWQAAERQAQELRDAQAAGQSAAQLREQALQQELAQSQSRTQELEAELRALRLTLAENDEQLVTLSARLQAERDQQQQAQARIAELAALVPPPAPEVPVVVRPAVSEAASLTGAELERLVLAAGAGQQPAPVEIDHQRPDDLKIIDGIGPVNERWLHAQGVRYFWQIASWSPAELAWVAHHLPNFGSRVYRENWIAQAAKLAAQQSMA